VLVESKSPRRYRASARALDVRPQSLVWPVTASELIPCAVLSTSRAQDPTHLRQVFAYIIPSSNLWARCYRCRLIGSR